MESSQSQIVVAADQLSKHVEVHDGNLTILSKVSLQIKKGESVAIVGVSGSGKSTLLSLLAGLDIPTSGSVSLCGEPLNNLDEDGRAHLRGEHIGFIFQSFQLLPSLTALENTLLPLEVMGLDNAVDTAQTLLSRVGLGQREKHYPNQLSGGEQQRVAIARAFATSPSVLFADEPTGNLDTATGETIIDLLFEMNKEKQTTLIMVTHDEHLAQRCDRSIHLESGRLITN